MPTATKLSPKKPARKRATKKLPVHGIKAAPGNPFAGLEHLFGSVALPPAPVLPATKDTAAVLITKVRTGDFAKHVDLSKVTAAKKPVRRRVMKKGSLPILKAVKGSPLAGLEHLIGCVTLPRDPRPRREILRARYLADHNT